MQVDVSGDARHLVRKIYMSLRKHVSVTLVTRHNLVLDRRGDSHVALAASGMITDAMVLVDMARKECLSHRYGSPILRGYYDASVSLTV